MKGSKEDRRAFLIRMAQLAALPAAVPWAAVAQPDGSTVPRPELCVFSKHLQFLNYPQLAVTCREAGLDGVDLTVRPKGHVLPENAVRDLPDAVRALRDEGLSVPMITTNLTSGSDESARPILETAASLGIPFFRVGGQKYREGAPPLDQLKAFTDEIASLIAIAKEVGMTAGYHNHSGYDYVGGALWDLRQMIEAVDSPHFGSNFDVGHTVVEGAYGAWKLNTQVMAPWVKMAAVKDFVWRDNKPSWAPVGKGVVPLTDQFKILRAAGFSGPVSLHIEYKVGGDTAMIEEVRRSVPVLREVLTDAGYPA